MPKTESYKTFRDECEKAGLEVQDYKGRNFYDGPAVSCDYIQDVTSVTTVDCQWDNLDKGWIVYPR